ncbi:MAG: putative chaperone protein [Paracoccaceae bacterium]
MTQATLGIDFGTSNSAAGIMSGGAPKRIALEPGAATIPTAVFFDADTCRTLMGDAANAALLDGEEGRYMRALKSVLGTSLMRETRRLPGRSLTFIEIIAEFLSAVKTRAEATEGRTFPRALSGRPVHFHSHDAVRDARALADLTECYLLAGFEDVAFMNEPEAAALSSGGLAAGETGLIVDIGGGTSDFSVFRAAGDGIEILASNGVRVGGTDFDKSVSIEHVMPMLGRGTDIRRDMGPGVHAAPISMFNELASWEKIPFLYTAQSRRDAEAMRRLAVEPEKFARLCRVLNHELGHDLAFAAERGKIAANHAGGAAIDLGKIERGLCAPITPASLAHATAPHAARIAACAVETLAMAGLPASAVDAVIFVGGSSLMHAVTGAMERLLPGATLRHSNAFTAVIDGLAIASART